MWIINSLGLSKGIFILLEVIGIEADGMYELQMQNMGKNETTIDDGSSSRLFRI